MKRKAFREGYSISQTHKDLTDNRYQLLRKPKNVLFFCNGDEHFRGKRIFITPHRYISYQDLMSDLTRKLPSTSSLAYGVRQIYTIDGGKRLGEIDELQDGGAYVCAGFESYRPIRYGVVNMEPWGSGVPNRLMETVNPKVTSKPIQGSYLSLYGGAGGNKLLQPVRRTNDRYAFRSNQAIGPHIKPKIITVVRSDSKPYATIKILLNRNSAQSFESVFQDISDSFQHYGVSEGMKYVYTLSGKPVCSLSDFFRGDSVFIFTHNDKVPLSDLQDVIRTLYPGSPYAQSLLRNVDKQKRKTKRLMLQALAYENRSVTPIIHEGKVRMQEEDNSLGGVKNSGAVVHPEFKPKVVRKKAQKTQHKPLHLLEEWQPPADVKLYKRLREKKKIAANNAQQIIEHSDLPKPDDQINKRAPVKGRSTVFKSSQDEARNSENDRSVKTKENRIIKVGEIHSKYDLGRTLGDGNFAVVKTCHHRETGHQYAMKVIDKLKLKGKEHMIENEMRIMKACDHENIVRLYDEYEDSENIYLVMEIVKGGDLFDAITQSVKFEEKVASTMTRDIASALFYLHSRRIVHRDIKPENLMVMRSKDHGIRLKLGDFGLAVEINGPIFTVCGTPTYVAPEILTEIGYGLEVDLWALGVITYILLCGFPPFRSPDRNQTELFEFIKEGHFDFLSPYWDNISKEAHSLISSLLIVEKSARYKATDVLSHPWIVSQGCSKNVSADTVQVIDDSKSTEQATKSQRNWTGTAAVNVA